MNEKTLASGSCDVYTLLSCLANPDRVLFKLAALRDRVGGAPRTDNRVEALSRRKRYREGIPS